MRESSASGMRGLARRALDDLAVDEVERVGRRLQHGAGHLQRRVLHRHARLQRGLAADAGAAAGPGAAAVGRGERVAGDHAHLLDGHAHGLGHDLADDGLRALALLGDAGGGHHRAVGIDAHGAAVLRRDARAADAVHEGAGVGQLDEACEADAAVDALARAAAPARRAGPGSRSCRAACRATRRATGPRTSCRRARCADSCRRASGCGGGTRPGRGRAPRRRDRRALPSRRWRSGGRRRGTGRSASCSAAPPWSWRGSWRSRRARRPGSRPGCPPPRWCADRPSRGRCPSGRRCRWR